LNYSATSLIAKLSEEPHPAADRHDPSVLYADKHVVAPWTINVQDDTGGVRLTSMKQSSPASSLVVTRNDKGVSAEWNGSGRGMMLITGAGDDLQSRYGDRALQVRLNIIRKPESGVYLGMQCALTFEESEAIKSGKLPMPVDHGSNCKSAKPAFFEITPQLKSATANSEIVISLPLSCFAKQGAVLSNVTSQLALVTTGQLGITLTDARFIKTATNTCPEGFADSAVTKTY
jgi:hypothetical protein